MTGRELIIYILENHLEDVEIFKDGVFPGLITVGEFAAKHDVGTSTVYAWIELGWINCVRINGMMYVSSELKPPEGVKV